MRKHIVFRTYTFFVTGFLLIFLMACDKKDIKGPVPVLTTAQVSDITGFSAITGGNITSDASIPITKRGICWSTKRDVTIADKKAANTTGSGSFVSKIGGLDPETTYYVRAYASNSNGTGYGSIRSFTTREGVTDIDGNGYNIVTIGSQIWMVENLKTTTFNDGNKIPWVTNDVKWRKLVTPGYTWYLNDSSTYRNPYGAYYNWYTVNTSKLCPEGWHVPTDKDWDILTDYLSGLEVAGGKLKEKGTVHWEGPNTGASNLTGFTAFPGGQRDWSGLFAFIGKYGYWWSTQEVTVFPDNAWVRAMYYDNTRFDRPGFSKKTGLGVRCLKD